MNKQKQPIQALSQFTQWLQTHTVICYQMKSHISSAKSDLFMQQILHEHAFIFLVFLMLHSIHIFFYVMPYILCIIK